MRPMWYWHSSSLASASAMRSQLSTARATSNIDCHALRSRIHVPRARSSEERPSGALYGLRRSKVSILLQKQNSLLNTI